MMEFDSRASFKPHVRVSASQNGSSSSSYNMHTKKPIIWKRTFPADSSSAERKEMQLHELKFEIKGSFVMENPLTHSLLKCQLLSSYVVGVCS